MGLDQFDLTGAGILPCNDLLHSTVRRLGENVHRFIQTERHDLFATPLHVIQPGFGRLFDGPGRRGCQQRDRYEQAHETRHGTPAPALHHVDQ